MSIRPSIVLSSLLLFSACGAKEVPVIPEYEAGEVHSLIQAYGRPMLVNLWATWCAPCIAELPDLEVVGQEFRADGGELVGLCMEYIDGSADPEKTKSRLPRFVSRRSLSFPIWLYSGRQDKDLFAGLALPRPRSGGIPITLAIDKQGKVVDFHEGRATREQLRELAKKAIGEQ